MNVLFGFVEHTAAFTPCGVTGHWSMFESAQRFLFTLSNQPRWLCSEMHWIFWWFSVVKIIFYSSSILKISMNLWILKQIIYHCIVGVSESHIFSCSKLNECRTVGQWQTFFIILWHFTKQTINCLITQISCRVIFHEN